MEAISRTPTGKKEEKVFESQLHLHDILPRCPGNVHSKHEKSKEVAKPDLVHHVAIWSVKSDNQKVIHSLKLTVRP